MKISILHIPPEHQSRLIDSTFFLYRRETIFYDHETLQTEDIALILQLGVPKAIKENNESVSMGAIKIELRDISTFPKLFVIRVRFAVILY